MNTRKIAFLALITTISSVLFSGCWNLTEVDKLAVVAGVAIDKGTNEKFCITAEVVEVGFGKESEPKPKILTTEGKTIFDAVRHMVTVIGKRLYWSHAKVVIISRDLAEEGVLQVLDWFSRDTETRSDIHVLVSDEMTAGEILTSHPLSETLVSYEIYEILDNQNKLHHAPEVQLWKFVNNMQSKGITAIATAIDLKQSNGKKCPDIEGTAVFKGDRLVGFVDGIDTMSLLFVQDKIKGGILIVDGEHSGKGTEVSLKILKSSTDVIPIIRNSSINIDIIINTDTSINEIDTSEDVITNEGRRWLEASAEKMLKAHIEGIINKAQKEYGADMFGFGEKFRRKEPSAWSIMEQDWSNAFRDIKINVETHVRVKNSAMLSKPLEVGY